MMCGGGTAFPTFDKGCTDAQKDAFDTAEQAWDQTCAMCGCAAQPLKAEDGKTCAMNVVTVTCDTGMCTTHCP
jgi:hypothetical protein